MYNIQVMIDMLPSCRKTRYNQIQSAIKTLVREIKNQKELIRNKVNPKVSKLSIPLFEVQPSEIQQIDMSELTSFFGSLDIE